MCEWMGERKPSECRLSGGRVPGTYHTFPWVERRRAQVRQITCGLYLARGLAWWWPENVGCRGRRRGRKEGETEAGCL